MTASAAVCSVAFFPVSFVVPSFHDCGHSFRVRHPVVPDRWIILEIYER